MIARARVRARVFVYSKHSVRINIFCSFGPSRRE